MDPCLSRSSTQDPYSNDPDSQATEEEPMRGPGIYLTDQRVTEEGLMGVLGALRGLRYLEIRFSKARSPSGRGEVGLQMA